MLGCMMWHRRAAVWCILATAAVAQGRCTLQVQGAVHGVRVRGDADYEASGASLRADLAAGAWRVQFAAGPAGRPMPIAVEAPGDGDVFIRVARGAGNAAAPTVLATSLHGSRTFDRGDERSARVAVRMCQPAGSGAAGLVGRWQDEERCYRFVRDQAAGELRLERRMGNAQYVLQRAPMLVADAAWHDLELEYDGFGLLALFDGEPVMRALDGGLSFGGCGTYAAAGVDAEFDQLIVAPPAAPLASVAVATSAGAAELRAFAPTQRGGVFALLLRLDRPTAMWPTDELGFEPFVLVRPAEPVFLLGFAGGYIGDDGALAGTLHWPDLPALRLQTALIGGYLGSPDASELRDRLPWAAVHF